MKSLLIVMILSSSAIAADIPRPWTQLAKDVEAAGGKIEFADGQPVAIDLYNGNNPLKGRGGRNAAVNDDWLKRLSGLTSLKKLSLSNCEVTDAGMAHVGTLTALEDLNLTLTPVTDAGFVHFGKLTKLKSLGLASSKCSGEGFKHLNVKDLDSVNFHFTPLNDAGLEAICDVGVTGRFWFAHVHFTDAGAKHLTKLADLKVLGIGSSDKESSGESVAALVELPLVDLSLLDHQADPVGFAYAARIRTLERLDAGHAPQVTDAELRLIAGLPSLRELRLGGASQVTDAGVLHLAACASLKKVTLQRLKNVTDEGIAALKRARPDLEVATK